MRGAHAARPALAARPRCSFNGPFYVLIDFLVRQWTRLTPQWTLLVRHWTLLTPQRTLFSANADFLARQWPLLVGQWALLKQVVLRIGVDAIPHEYFHGAGFVLRIIVVLSV